MWLEFATANGSAKTATTITLPVGDLYFAPGQTSQTIEIVIKGDAKKEQNERFYVNLSGASGGTISDGQAMGTILNDDSGGKGAFERRAETLTASAVDAAMMELMSDPPKKRAQ